MMTQRQRWAKMLNSCGNRVARERGPSSVVAPEGEPVAAPKAARKRTAAKRPAAPKRKAAKKARRR